MKSRTLFSPVSPPQTAIDIARRSQALSLVPNKPLLRVAEAAGLIGVSAWVIRTYLDRGVLRAKVINSVMEPEPERKHVRVTTESVIAFLQDEGRDS